MKTIQVFKVANFELKLTAHCGPWTNRNKLHIVVTSSRPYLERVASLCVYHCLSGGPSDQILDLFGAVVDAGGKPECPEKNLQKQV